MNIDKIKLDRVLASVEKPARYTGGEWNTVTKQDAALSIALCFPDVYEIGMSHLGSHILYSTLNAYPDFYCQRAYTPWPDMERALRENEIPLFSIECKKPLDTFDIVGFSLLYEMCYTNILTMLELSGIPLLSKDRTDGCPLILCGGPSACNPEPLSEIIDAVLLGDGEELFPEVAAAVLAARNEGVSRHEILRRLSKIEGVYIPGFYAAKYEGGRFVGIDKLEPCAPNRPRRRVVKNLDTAAYLAAPVVPNMGVVHDRIALELFRGCTRGCRFCQAGYIYRPVRERKLHTLLPCAQNLLCSTGYDELSLFSLSTSDYSSLHGLIGGLLDETEGRHVTLSLPSLRIDASLKKELERMQGERKAGLTFAPEAGTQRLRDVINKGVTQEDLLQSARDAFEAGWTSVKLYFMIGLPTETDEDILGIADLVRKVSIAYHTMPKERRAKPLRLSVSASSFVPKPFTPFQWVAQDTQEELIRKQRLLGQALRGIRGVDYKYHEGSVSVLEAVFARADRRLNAVVLDAYRKGCRFDSWAEYFRPSLWEEAFAACGLKMADYAHRVRSVDEPLPWDHIDMWVTKDYLREEYEHACNESITVDCRKGCNGCFGEDVLRACCFEGVDQPQEQIATQHQSPQTAADALPAQAAANAFAGVRMAAQLQKGEEARFISHLDVQRLLQRAMRRAALPLAYSQGFNPHPVLAFASALAVGYTSDAEWFDVKLQSEVAPETFVARMNTALPVGMHIACARIIPESMPTLTALLQSARYTVDISFSQDVSVDALRAGIVTLLAGEIIVTKRTKGGMKQVDIRPHVLDMQLLEVEGNAARLDITGMLNTSGGLQMELLLQAYMAATQLEGHWRIHRTAVTFDQFEV